MAIHPNTHQHTPRSRFHCTLQLSLCPLCLLSQSLSPIFPISPALPKMPAKSTCSRWSGTSVAPPLSALIVIITILIYSCTLPFIYNSHPASKTQSNNPGAPSAHAYQPPLSKSSSTTSNGPSCLQLQAMVHCVSSNIGHVKIAQLRRQNSHQNYLPVSKTRYKNSGALSAHAYQPPLSKSPPTTSDGPSCLQLPAAILNTSKSPNCNNSILVKTTCPSIQDHPASRTPADDE